MASERFRQIVELYHSVREGSAAERATLLQDADPELRREVESLLAHSTEGAFLERPAVEDALSLLAKRADPALAEGTCLGPYRIERKLGEGGMGEVYRAVDTRLDRAVAIKIVRERIDARFRREAHAIASLNHPNICALFDIGTDFMVMELVEGETLAARIKHGPLPLKTTLVYASQILAALAEAHSRGIVHRDLKPGNIMIANSGIKVLDFGLAKFLADETRTAIGDVMGTPAYMAPEQRQGQADPRSDIWSFGCVLHEMLTGTRVGARRKHLPSRRLERIVERCLEEDPARRWQTIAELQRELSTVRVSAGWRGFATDAVTRMLDSRRARLVTAACMLVIIAAVTAGIFFVHRAHPLSDKDTIVLADFANRTGDAVFDGALRQGLAVQLEQSPFLSIVPEGLVRQTLALMGRKTDAALTSEVAMDLCQRVGSAAVIEGAIAQVGTPYQLTLRALDCASGKTIASAEAEAPDKNHVLEALGTSSSNLRAKLGESLRTVQKFDTPLEQATTSSLEALKAYSEGMKFMWNGTDIPTAILFFQRALELDPQFAQAYGVLAIAYTTQGESRLAAGYARKAYALRDKVSEPEKYFILSRYGKSASGNIDMAIQACLSWIHAYPRSALPRSELGGSIYPVAGEYEKAVAQLTESIRLMPTLAVSYAFLMDAYIALDRFDDAKNVYDQVRKRNLHSGFYVFNLYQLAFLQHDRTGMARQVAAARGQPGAESPLLAWDAETAGYYGQLGKSRDISDQAVESAQRAGEQEPAGIYLAMSALREALYGNPKQAEQRTASALERASARDVLFGTAMALAYAGNGTRAAALADELAHEYPEDTLVQRNYLPALRAKLALDHGNTADALAILKTATAYEYSMTRFSVFGWTSLYPIYVRGEAYLAMHDVRKAAAEFQKILDHPGLALNYPIGTMARLQRARALFGAGEREASAAAYRELLGIWKDADPDLPVLKQAKAEAARLD